MANISRNSSCPIVVPPVIETLADLVRIDSVNPSLPAGRGETMIIRFIRHFFEERDIEVCEQEVLPGRSNLIARLAGRKESGGAIFEAHCDTASTVGMNIAPFEPVLSDGKLYGRGSCDTKAGLAAMMHAMASLKEEGVIPPCEVRFAATVDEEYGYAGVRRLCKDLKALAAVVAEPTSMRAAIASKGSIRLQITCRGRAAHSSKPHLGINAIVHMGQVIQALEAGQAELARVIHPLVGSPTCNIGTVHGGVQPNIVPDLCRIEVDRRLIPGERPDSVVSHYRRLIESVKVENPGMDCSIEVSKEDTPLETSADSPVATLASAVLQHMGLDPELVGVPYCSDASKLSAAGIPTIILGPGRIDEAHAAIEYVECEQVEQAFCFYKKFMMLWA